MFLNWRRECMLSWKKKIPNEDWMNEMVNDWDGFGDNSTPYEVVNVDESMDGVQTSRGDPKETYLTYHSTSKKNLYSSQENIGMKVSTRKELHEQQSSQQIDILEKGNDGAIQHQVENAVETHDSVQASKNYTKPNHASYDPKAKEHHVNPSSPHKQRSVEKQRVVVMLSMNSRNKDLMVGRGILESRHSEYMVGGHKIGDAFFAVTIQHASSKFGREKLPRPYGDLLTVEDAIGQCIAWPRTHVKKFKEKSN